MHHNRQTPVLFSRICRFPPHRLGVSFRSASFTIQEEISKISKNIIAACVIGKQENRTVLFEEESSYSYPVEISLVFASEEIIQLDNPIIIEYIHMVTSDSSR